MNKQQHNCAHQYKYGRQNRGNDGNIAFHFHGSFSSLLRFRVSSFRFSTHILRHAAYIFCSNENHALIARSFLNRESRAVLSSVVLFLIVAIVRALTSPRRLSTVVVHIIALHTECYSFSFTFNCMLMNLVFSCVESVSSLMHSQQHRNARISMTVFMTIV